MIIFIPLGKKISFSSLPWVVIFLMLANIAVFVYVWPKEKKIINNELEYKQVINQATRLIDILILDNSYISDETKIFLRNAQKLEELPFDIIEKIFEDYNQNIQESGYTINNKWVLLYPKYQALKRSLNLTNNKKISFFSDYGFSATRKVFPNIITYQFLHKGYLHLFFNLFFLLIVGSYLEERYGGLTVLFIYIVGGAVAALFQGSVLLGNSTNIVGSSGSIAALVGVFLIRHLVTKIKVFYLVVFLVIIRYGYFYVPAWVALSLWFVQQTLSSFILEKGIAEVSYFTHLGGLLFGLVSGVFLRVFNLDKYLENYSNYNRLTQKEKIEQGLRSLELNCFKEAENLFKDVLSANPFNLEARQALISLYEKTNRYDDLLNVLFNWLSIDSNKENLYLAETAIEKIEEIKTGIEFNLMELLRYAYYLEKLGHWEKAVSVYKDIINKYPLDKQTPKAFFAIGKIYKEKLNKKQEARAYFERLTLPPFNVEWGSLAKKYLGD